MSKLRVVVHNVGHGHSIHAFTPTGETIVVDLGCSGTFSPLEWLRKQTDCIDSLIITHPHGDHIDEIHGLRAHGFNVRQLWRPNWLPKEEVYAQNQSTFNDKVDSYFELSDRYNTPIPTGERVGDPTVSKVSIKEFASSGCGVSNINNHSGVVVFEYCNSKIVISGDNEPPSWGALAKQPGFCEAVTNADIFLASHHGRESGYHPDLFKLFKPKLCLVSDGRVRDTDAVDRYSYHAQGWLVHKKKDTTKDARNCLTTRSDGYIDIEVGKNPNGNNFLQVSIP
jgi:beta-lactamase superfamily II metal-dependent hydrolase